jgi:hypothetical protein
MATNLSTSHQQSRNTSRTTINLNTNYWTTLDNADEVNIQMLKISRDLKRCNFTFADIFQAVSLAEFNEKEMKGTWFCLMPIQLNSD